MNQNDIEAMIQRYMEAEMAVLDGKSVTFNGQQMTMENLSEIRQGRQEWERRLAALITRRRGHPGYLILQDWFIGAVTRPMYRAWLKQAVASGVIRLPRDLDRSSLYTAVYSGPVMPWIDPVKEAEAWKIQIRGGAATESDWVRAGGRNPDDVKRRRKAEIDENRKLDLVFDTDPASDKGGSSAATKRQEPQHTDDQSEE